MSWEEFINHILTSSTKIDKVAVFDYKGRPVAITDDIETCESDGFAFTKCLSDSTKTMTRLNIDNDIYQCFHGINHTLIGRRVKDPGCMLVARQDGDFVIVIIGRPEGEESFLHELKDGLHRKAQGTLIGQVQPQPPQPQMPPQPAGGLLPVPPSPASKNRPRGPPVTTDEVLVDITG